MDYTPGQGKQRQRFIGAVAAGVVTLGASVALAAPAQASTITIAGTVACKNGHTIQGLWISSSAGGSKWATVTNRSGVGWVADYTASVVPKSLPTTIRLDLGCGGTSSSWQSNNSSPSRAGVKASVTLNSLCKEPSTTASRAVRCSWWSGSALVGMPFTGIWGISGEPPSTHAFSETGAQWAIDLYQSDGTAVKPYIFGPKSDKFSLTVAGTWFSCGGAAGQGIRLNVLKNGTKIGAITFTHLNSLKVTSGTVNNGTVLGYLKQWAYSDCYKVKNPAGVHTHFTAGNSPTGWACWAPLSLGSSYAQGRWFGSVGATGATTKQSCP